MMGRCEFYLHLTINVDTRVESYKLNICMILVSEDTHLYLVPVLMLRVRGCRWPEDVALVLEELL